MEHILNAWDRWETRFFGAGFALSSFLAAEPWLTLPMKWATFCYFLLVSGIALRKRSQRAHNMLMLSGVAGDLALVLVLQVQRHAVQTAVAFSLSPLQQAHVGFSTVATALYLPLLYLGWKQWRHPGSVKPGLHRKLGMIAFFCRTAGFLLMFSLLEHYSRR